MHSAAVVCVMLTTEQTPAPRWFRRGVHLARDALGSEAGEVSVNGMLTMGLGMVFIAVGFVIFPIVMTGATGIITYSYSSNASLNYSYYTGLTSVGGILPLVILLGFVMDGVIVGFMGYKATRAGTNAGLEPKRLMYGALGLVFIAVALIIMPVLLDGISSALHNGGAGISSSFTGLASVLKIVPLIVLAAFMGGGIAGSYFQTKKAVSI